MFCGVLLGRASHCSAIPASSSASSSVGEFQRLFDEPPSLQSRSFFPKPKPPTKWDLFAQKKGIQNRSK